MYFFTHLFISKVLYLQYSKTGILRRFAFSYGNIKPDLPPMCLRKCHTADNYLFLIHREINQLMENGPDSVRFSVKLGEICHFATDFFCYYHKDKKTYNRKFGHFFYELTLHAYLHLGGIKKELAEFSYEAEPRRSIPLIISELQKKYHLESRSMKTDLTFALAASTWICDSVLCFMQDFLAAPTPAEAGMPAYKSVQGGNI